MPILARAGRAFHAIYESKMPIFWGFLLKCQSRKKSELRLRRLGASSGDDRAASADSTVASRARTRPKASHTLLRAEQREYAKRISLGRPGMIYLQLIFTRMMTRRHCF